MVEECRRRIPLGVRIFTAKKKDAAKPNRKAYQTSALLLTFIAYASFHASRKPSSIVKSVLDPEKTKVSTNSVGFSTPMWLLRKLGVRLPESDQGWAPFNGEDGKALLGDIDMVFLASYSLGMYFAGHLGDRLDLRVFLSAGMVGSGALVALYGMGYWWNIHSLYYYIGIQTIAGFFQATGWPSVVAVMGNWFGKSKRGLIMGVWNAHTSVGNILGSLIASSVLGFGWGWSYIVPAALITAVGILVYLFLVVSPEDVGILSVPGSPGSDIENGFLKEAEKESDESELQAPLLEPVPCSASSSASSSGGEAIGFLEAWKIPGVAPFALCLFFSKLVAYTFLYWLPFYISHTAINGKYLSDETAGNLSTLFDVGGVVGGIIAGHISDRLEARAITAASFMYCAIPVLILYRVYGSTSIAVNIGLMMLAGVFVNGPYALITTAVCADLGTHTSLKGNSRALATVTAIIDGTGSVGAALGPFLTGFISTGSWTAVFTMLMAAAFVAGLLLSRLVVAEVMAKVSRARELRSAQ